MGVAANPAPIIMLMILAHSSCSPWIGGARWCASLGITIVSEGRRIFGRLSVEENLEMGGYLCDDKKSLKAGIRTEGMSDRD